MGTIYYQAVIPKYKLKEYRNNCDDYSIDKGIFPSPPYFTVFLYSQFSCITAYDFKPYS